MTPLISIVTGTYQRITFLQDMVNSARATLPSTIPHEFVIVDGGSNDGTQDWCKAQPDIVLIEHGELLGAIKAFNAGAMAARGQYVILGNDDIMYHEGSIMRALVHLEDNPNCGAVAFADNRNIGYKLEVAPGYGVQRIQAQSQPVIYAQVGMFRKWLGDILGWWGITDPIMRQANTYGGDNYLSARIWEMGFTVDAVRGVTVEDRYQDARDDLRQRNFDIETERGSAYYRRYPEPPQIADHPIIPAIDEGQMRILYLPIYEPGVHYHNQKQGKRGLREAFGRIGLVWEVDYIAAHRNREFDLVELVDSFAPDLLFLQLHSTVEIQADSLARARARKPEMLVINWNGDVYARHLLEDGMVDVLRLCDLQCCVNASVLPCYEAQGIQAVYWQCGFEPIDESILPNMPAYDIVFTGNCYSDERTEFGRFMDSLSDVNIGIYGSGWANAGGNTTYNFPASRALYRNCKLILGDNQWMQDIGFVSNRVFDTLAAGGGILLHQHVPGMLEYTGITPDEHFVEWTDLDDLHQKIIYWLNPEMASERQAMAARARAFMESDHSFDARLRELFFTILPAIEMKTMV